MDFEIISDEVKTPEVDLGLLINAKNKLPMRHQIMMLEDQLKAMPQVELKTSHHFADGLYAREMFIPAGTMLTGAVHLFEHINIISQGDISVVTEEGTKRIQAPATLVSLPGTKRVGYAHTDTIWTTIHATGATTVEAAEAELVVADHSGKSYAEAMAEMKLINESRHHIQDHTL